jgi:transposase
MTVHYIAFDVHCQFTEVAVMTPSGRVTRRTRCGTTIPELVEVLESIRQPRRLTFEEGPMADWLYRNLLGRVEELLVCDPRRNQLIAKEGEKDDSIDAAKLAELYRGGYLKAVHHPRSLQRSILKQHVGLYHDRVRQRVREANYLIAQLRRHGVVVNEAAFSDPNHRPLLLTLLPKSMLLRSDLELLWRGYDVAAEQEAQMRCSLTQQAQRHEPVRRFQQLPGYGWIRAATFYVYVDTPWRFPRKSALWKYAGIGLERRHSGNGPMKLRVVRRANKRLKNVVLGAAGSAVLQADNPFAERYRSWTRKGGMSTPNARRSVARLQTATLWGMWKNGSEYQAELVGCGAAANVARSSRQEDGIQGVRQSSVGGYGPGLRRRVPLRE